MCIFLNQINTVGIIIRSCFFLCQPVADRIEKDVTGIPNCLENIVKSVTARINPAFWFVTDVIINSGTPDLVGVLAMMTGVTKKTIQNKYHRPETYSLDEIQKIATVLKFTPIQALSCSWPVPSKGIKEFILL